jgi:hypothetical protein
MLLTFLEEKDAISVLQFLLPNPQCWPIAERFGLFDGKPIVPSKGRETR